MQHFMWGDSSELNLENNKGSGSDNVQVRNQVTLNDEKNRLFEESYVDIVSAA